MQYVVVVQVPGFALEPGRFAIESAFAEHLRKLRASIGPEFDTLVVLAPAMPLEAYQAQQAHLGVLEAGADGIAFEPAFLESCSAATFWRRHAGPTFRRVTALMQEGAVLHSGLSTDLWRPLMLLANLAAFTARMPILFVVDIDFRQHSRQLRAIGHWSRRAYLTNRLVHDRLKALQVRLAVRFCNLVMLKSATMVRDFGRGRAHVKDFFDTAHDAAHVVGSDHTARRRDLLCAPGPLRAVYFGRLARSKGVDRMIEAVRLARLAGADVVLDIVGDGPERQALMAQARDADLLDRVRFVPALPYGAALFDQVDKAHVALAAPLIEDTPRAAFDAFARGLPVLAFDLTYFRDLAAASGAVVLAAWPDPSSMAERLAVLAADGEALASLGERVVAFARDNTQGEWLARRAQWMRTFALPRALARAGEIRRARSSGAPGKHLPSALR